MDVQVINRMADGSICDDLTGKVIPVNARTEMAYKIIAKILKRMMSEEKKVLNE